ncbi:MAG: glycosyltransferase family 2 protein [Alphaproteobacteria bacterium]|jgi:glycosyltransferase involved in cell wall biosynthesis|nr:glycosyltransferase family 2 protein [Alphaproteobacteria bacterium]
MKTIEILLPVYNEEENIFNFIEECNKVIKDIPSVSFTYCFINDGSSDNTKLLILQAIRKYGNVSLIDFSKNFGKEQAIMAGIKNTKADACIICDVDLQDPLYIIKDFISLWQQGYNMVYGVRNNRDTDSFLKKKTSSLFYKFYNLISGIKIPFNAGDFRLLDRKVINSIAKINNKHLFMKGIYHVVGFSQIEVSYKREKRAFGKTKFNYFKLFKLALDGIFNTTSLPLRLSSVFGFILASVAFIYGIVIVIDKLVFGNSIRGYPSIMVSILFLFGIQFLFMGLLGEYISRIFDEIKGSPNSVINEIINKDNINNFY